VQEAEFVVFWVDQDVPALGAALADVGGSSAESEQPLQLGVLVAVGGVDVDVQPELPGPRVGTRAEDEGRLQAAEADVRGSREVTNRTGRNFGRRVHGVAPVPTVDRCPPTWPLCLHS